MKIYIGADHRGFELKQQLKSWLKETGRVVIDCGNLILDPKDDFPDYAFAVADKVVSDPDSRGILLCGSAGGMTIAANKVKGIRATEGVNANDVIHNRTHNNINILVISPAIINIQNARLLVDAFLDTTYVPEERFVRRLSKIAAREK